MTGYLQDKYTRLQERFWELPDTEENFLKFRGLLRLIGWIETHENASDLQYINEMERVREMISA